MYLWGQSDQLSVNIAWVRIALANTKSKFVQKESLMPASAASVVTLILLSTTSVLSHAGCSPTFTTLFESTQRIVDSIRPDKPGQTRVFASDGSEFSGAEALWMKGQLRSVLQECAQGDEGKADATLRGVNELLRAHRRST
jgi:hypothetical protein